MSIKNKKSYKNKLVPLIIIAALLLTAAVFVGWRIHHRTTPQNVTLGPGEINFNPPTKEEQQAGDEKKEEITKEQDTPPTTPTGKADVVVTYASQYENGVEVGGYVSNIVEEGGTCKLTLSNDTKTLTATTTGVANAHSTDCPALVISRDKLSTGTWTAILSYSSAKASGSAQPKDVIVK